MRAGHLALNKPFDAYAAYYDLLYAQKDYAGEAAYIDRLIRQHHHCAGSLLELGSGTGGHAVHFAQLGYAVHGIDLSPEMIALARARRAATGGPSPTFETADLRAFRTQRRFDAVVSLFHVMSYQVSDEDVREAMVTAATHLEPGGVFVFDCWYGPGVLADPPSSRMRRLSGNGVSIVRTAHPKHDPASHRVDVRYEIDVIRDGARQRIEELHPMRYFFADELKVFLEKAGLHCVSASAWGREDFGNGLPWYACFTAMR
jgi:SAM-dependent methyltransferase